METEFYIIKRITYPVTLGLQFLQTSNAKIDFHNSELKLQHGVSSVQMNNVSVPVPKYM
jgi:hypothetical protein